MSEILVVANETLGGRKLRELLEQKAKVNPSLHVRLVIPQSRPRRGSVIYVQSVRDAAQVRLDLALSVLDELGFEATGEVGDSDPFHATMDAIAERKPDEIVISTLPVAASGWLRRDLVERVADASGIAVQHGDGKALAAAQAHLADVLAGLRDAGLVVSGLVGDPDPFTATLNALQFFRVTRVVISTLPETKSGWLRADLVERVRRYAVCPVEHFVANPAEAVAAS
jgi:hypothetical protein